MKEAYVSFEIAQLLKEKGFDWECHKYWEDHYGPEGLLQRLESCSSDYQPFEDEYLAPTQQMAMRWLREEKGIFIEIYPEFGDVEIAWCHGDYEETLIGYGVKIINLDYCEVKHDFLVKNSYEDAVEAALKYCLTELILRL